MTVEELFDELGKLDKRFEPRPQQLAMARAVASALAAESPLVVEAGTGVGKSLAYLLPGALWAVAHGRRLLVSTHTRALQEQVLEHDLPLAAEVIARKGLELRFAMLQGSDNYLCVQRLARLQKQPDLLSTTRPLVESLSAWARGAQTGHRSALPSLIPQGLWHRISRDPEVCLGASGPYWGSCLWKKDRERAERAHVVVVNHALLLSGARLPSYDGLVIDEAHNIEEIAAERFGLTVSHARLARLAEDCLLVAHGREPLLKAARAFALEAPRWLGGIAEAHGLSAESSEPGSKLLEQGRWGEPPGLRALEKELLEAAAACAKQEEGLELRLLQARSEGLRAAAESVLAGADEQHARWIERSASGVELRLVPLEVGERLNEALFGRGVPAVLTSATLSNGRGLKGFKSRLGLECANELVVDSPFDYQSQAALLVCDDLPAPSDDRKYIAALSRRCREIVTKVPGGSFILFSSWKSLRAVHARLRRTIKDRPVWMQGAAGSEQLLADFAEAGNAVLLGVDTFWQGVDVPGAALSCVVVVKLPFPNISSPVEEARRRFCESMGRSYFDAHSLPRAIMKFRQGFGRLIRSSTDRGAVVVLDPRLPRKGYGGAFLESLPRCRRLNSLEELESFFQEQPSSNPVP